MAIKWNEKMAIKALETLTNPFELQNAVETTSTKPRLSEVIKLIRGNGGSVPSQEIAS